MAANVNAALSSAKAVARVAIFGGLAVYGATNSLFNVEGGHRAIVFNRALGIKDQVLHRVYVEYP